jgi:hypothetical protein
MADEDIVPKNGGALKEQVSFIRDRQKELVSTTNELREDLLTLRGDVVTQEKFDRLLEKVGEIDKQVTALKERLTIYNLAQATFTTIIGAVAAVLGVLFK